jgi:hypothetical protein
MSPWEVMAILAQHERRFGERIRLQHEAQLQRERDYMVFGLVLGERAPSLAVRPRTRA